MPTHAFVLLLGLLALAAESAVGAGPRAWPSTHIALQRQYNIINDEEFVKPWYYDFPHRRLRTDIHLVQKKGAVAPAGGISNFSSYWIDDTLSMYDFVGGNCTKLEMGFGMMMPNWFLSGGTPMPNVFLTQRSVATSNGTSAFHNCSWTRKSGFDYFADEAGAAFRLAAGSPAGYVINDFVSMTAVAKIDDAIFKLPDIPCTPTTELPAGIPWTWISSI